MLIRSHFVLALLSLSSTALGLWEGPAGQQLMVDDARSDASHHRFYSHHDGHHDGHHGRHRQDDSAARRLAPSRPKHSDQVFNLYQASKRLIALSDSERVWMDETQIFDLIRAGRTFMDVTDGDLEGVSNLKKPEKIPVPKEVKYPYVVNPLSQNISQSIMENFLTEFSSFKTRYFQTQHGKDASEWLHTQITDVASSASEDVKVTVSKFKHSWPQFSIIARLEAAAVSEAKKGGIVIIGGHLDSVNQWNPWWGRSPGADDDGSGTTTVFEAFRILVANGFVPERPIEFHWYSAEEGGLLGSQKVVAKYQEDGVSVAGMYQIDMTGFTPEDKEPVIGISTDFVDDSLTTYLRKLSEEYSSVKWIDTKCGYGCSDHASWTKAGYPSVFTFEAAFDDHSPYIHTTDDDVSHIDFEHIARFVKLAVAFGVEVSLA
ncbi:uncharacterized protein BJ171DRAFT_490842 [Polychytrium aggregatum]|uniref:uncharacterized protein n=1 Tax=Polychytrium aggregatum TaxID=110093 RepID=UPI0022FDDCDC|nr:uncharacterized protein BJ171DRAFT_490842 [Polychytrium aggregatum]KAI9208267.1 hypothetical protein BJ171DRAFT_490842 [Polychytrium aggregatum]